MHAAQVELNSALEAQLSVMSQEAAEELPCDLKEWVLDWVCKNPLAVQRVRNAVSSAVELPPVANETKFQQIEHSMAALFISGIALGYRTAQAQEAADALEGMLGVQA